MINSKTITLFLLGMATLCHAQDNVVTSPTAPDFADAPIIDSLLQPAPIEPELHLPALTGHGTFPSFHMPYGYWWNSWNLHQGLNAALDLSVFSTFGSGHTWSGAGFSQSISLAYAMPLSKRLSLAIGGYMTNSSWAHDSYRDAGLSAIMGYQINEKWDGYVYMQKSILKPSMPYPLYDLSDVGDRIGLSVEYHVTPSFHIGVSLEQRFNQPVFPY